MRTTIGTRRLLAGVKKFIPYITVDAASVVPLWGYRSVDGITCDQASVVPFFNWFSTDGISADCVSIIPYQAQSPSNDFYMTSVGTSPTWYTKFFFSGPAFKALLNAKAQPWTTLTITGSLNGNNGTYTIGSYSSSPYKGAFLQLSAGQHCPAIETGYSTWDQAIINSKTNLILTIT